MQEQILYEDNHLLVINKKPGQLVQGDKTGDASLLDLLKEFIKIRDQKPGNVFLGLVHRIDRPTSGAVIFAKTSKALSRMTQMFKERKVEKIYWAIIPKSPLEESGTLIHYLRKNEANNKASVFTKETSTAKKAILHFKKIQQSDRYTLLEIQLETGRHHQIRAQLASTGNPIKGDLKYGAPRSNPDGGISLHARRLHFQHPVSKAPLDITAPLPVSDAVWKFFDQK